MVDTWFFFLNKIRFLTVSRTNKFDIFQIWKYISKYVLKCIVSERLLFSAKWAIFQPYHGKNKLIWWEDDGVHFVLNQHAELDLYSKTSLCSFSLMLRAYQRSSKYQFYSFWFIPTGAWIHHLPHPRRAR